MIEWNEKIIANGETIKIDNVGNILQYSGGINPIACQQCKKKFTHKIIETNITESVPVYKCIDCNFKNASGEATYDHKIETNHNIKKTTDSRIVAIKKQLSGDIANIIKNDNDIRIICDWCLNDK